MKPGPNLALRLDQAGEPDVAERTAVMNRSFDDDYRRHLGRGARWLPRMRRWSGRVTVAVVQTEVGQATPAGSGDVDRSSGRDRKSTSRASQPQHKEGGSK